MQRAYYSNTIGNFLTDDPIAVLGKLVQHSEFDVEQSQRDAWLAEIDHLKSRLIGYSGSIYFEYAIPRMGKRVDVVLVIGAAIFVLEYKVGEVQFAPYNMDQVVDYALAPDRRRVITLSSSTRKSFWGSAANRWCSVVVEGTPGPAFTLRGNILRAGNDKRRPEEHGKTRATPGRPHIPTTKTGRPPVDHLAAPPTHAKPPASAASQA